MRNRGRPTKLNESVKDEIVLILKNGNYLETAAAFAGVNKQTLYNWMKRGRRELERVNAVKGRKIRKSEQRYVEFLDAVERAMAEAETEAVEVIYNAASSDWRAAAWRLEHRYPDRWGRKNKHQVTGRADGPIEVDMNIEEVRQRLINKLIKLADTREECE